MTTSQYIGITMIVVALLYGITSAWPNFWRTLFAKAKANSQLVVMFALAAAGVLFVVEPSGCKLPVVPIVNKTYPDAWVVIIEESSSRDKATALLLQDWTWRQSLEERDINLRVYDDDQKEAEGYRKLNLPLPAIVFILPDGKVVKATKMPTTKKDVESLIHEVTGK